jgi:hypothetical protein
MPWLPRVAFLAGLLLSLGACQKPGEPTTPGNPNELNRLTAKAMLTGKLVLDSVTIPDAWGTADCLEQHGYISSAFGGYTIEPSASSSLKSMPSQGYTPYRTLNFATYPPVDIQQVTGITANANALASNSSQKVVEFLATANLNGPAFPEPMRACLHDLTSPHPARAVMQLYDDGWRIVEWQLITAPST